MQPLNRRRALITGGAGDLGTVAVRTLLDLGAEDVLVVDRDSARLERFRGVFRERVSTLTMDVADPAAWESLSGNRFDVLIPAAGVSHRDPFVDSSIEDWRDTIEVNLIGTMLAVRTLLPGMIQQRWGRIILISSVAAQKGLPERAVYSASKAALEALARTLAAEIGGTGVLVNCIAPGMFETELNAQWRAANPSAADAFKQSIPEGRFGAREELAGAFRYLLETTYAQASIVRVDGGWSAV